MPPRRRLDAELVRRGLARSRQHAAELIETGNVLVSGSVAERVARRVAPDEPVVILAPPPRFVSRGGEKLEAALERFKINVEGLTVLDAGASTGGFTDCLLQRGASAVVAVDVGRAQLVDTLKRDPRVLSLERTDIRSVPKGALPVDSFPLIVADLSFVALARVAAALVGLSAERGDLVILVKPQFEATRSEASRVKGVIRDPAIWERTLTDALVALLTEGTALVDLMVSPIRGGQGNVEFLVHLRHAGGKQADGGPSREAATPASVGPEGQPAQDIAQPAGERYRAAVSDAVSRVLTQVQNQQWTERKTQ